MPHRWDSLGCPSWPNLGRFPALCAPELLLCTVPKAWLALKMQISSDGTGAEESGAAFLFAVPVIHYRQFSQGGAPVEICSAPTSRHCSAFWHLLLVLNCCPRSFSTKGKVRNLKSSQRKTPWVQHFSGKGSQDSKLGILYYVRPVASP